MRTVIALIIIIYLVGVGVALAPDIRTRWNSAPAAELAAGVGQALPNALAWPVRAYHNIADKG
jgi:hypothetical protein